MSLKFSVPDRATPITTADGKTMSMEWYLAISAIVQQLGGPSVVPGGSAITDAVIIEAIDDARNSSDSVPLLNSNIKDAALLAAIDNSSDFSDLIPTFSSHVRNSELLEAFDEIDIASAQVSSLIQSNKNLSISLELSIQDGIEAINQAKIALQSAIIEQATMLDVIRSMASQDASHVDIRGGLIDGTTIGSRTPATATVTTLNKLTFTQPATSATLTIADGKTFSVSNTLTLIGTDGTTITFPTTSATVARTDASNTFTGHQTIEGVTSTGATGTGKFVFDTSPTIASATLSGAITASGQVTGKLTFDDVDGDRIQFNGTAANSYKITKTTAISGGDSLFKFTSGATSAGEFGFYCGSTLALFVGAGGGLTAYAGFGCNGKSAQTAYSLGGAATDLASVLTLANNLRTMSINNGTGN